jgi:RecA-family ATPase
LFNEAGNAVEIEAPGMLVERLIPACELALLSGAGGVGKSMFALQLAVCCAAGRPFLDRATSQCNALYVTAEDSKDTFQQRLAAIFKHLELSPDKIAKLRDGLKFHVLDGPAELVELDGHPTDALHALAGLAKGRALVILDPLALLFGSQDDWRQIPAYQFIGAIRSMLCRRHKRTVLLTCHHNKGGVNSREADSRHVMGSAGFVNACRCHLELSQQDGSSIQLARPKANFLPRMKPIHLKRRTDGVLELGSPPAKPAKGQSQADDRWSD